MIRMAFERVEVLADPAAMALLYAHHEEIVGAHVPIFTQANVEQYKQLESKELLRILVAWDEKQNPVGYVVFFVTSSLQGNERVAQCDMYYVRPDQRYHFVGLQLMSTMIKHLVEVERVTKIRGMSSAKLDTSALWRWLGFEMTG